MACTLWDGPLCPEGRLVRNSAPYSQPLLYYHLEGMCARVPTFRQPRLGVGRPRPPSPLRIKPEYCKFSEASEECFPKGLVAFRPIDPY